MKPLTIKNKTFGTGCPKICIPITGRKESEILETAGRLATLPHDIVEWRCDYYEAVTDLSLVRRIMTALKKRLPESLLLFTFRTKKEGGVRDLSEEQYLKLCRMAATSGLTDLLDLELFTGAKTSNVSENADCATVVPDQALLAPLLCLAHNSGCHVILSNHDFKKTPPEDELFRRLSLMEAAGADLAKLAVMPQKEQDVLTLLSATRKAADSLSCPVVTMSMGSLGVISRISGKLTGSCMTFGTAGKASAPGQLPSETLNNILAVL